MKNRKVKFYKESAIMQDATKPSDESYNETQIENDDDSVIANATPTLQAQDVDGLEDKDVMNYVYFNAPQDIDDSTRQALFNRADQIRQKQMNGSTTPQDQEKFAKGVIAAATQTKNKAKLGESFDYSVQAWVKAITGKSGEKGRNGSANWIGDDLYDEVEENEDGRIHYYNNWIGKVDRDSKTIFINDETAPRMTVNNLIRAAKSIGYKAKRTHETRKMMDMGFEDDADPMYAESYTSGRVDGGDEYDFSDAISAHYDDRKTLEEFCLELVWELEVHLEEQFGLWGKEVHDIIAKWISQNKEWVRERFGLHDEVTESDVIRARKMMLPILQKKFGKDKATLGEAYSSGRVDTFDEPYYGGGESDWGIDEEDSTYRSPYHAPSKEHEEFMRGEDSQRIDLLSGLKEAVSDRIDDLTDGEIDADDVYNFVSDYIDNAHKKYTVEELKKFSKIYTGKVDFFAKTILAKYKKRNGIEEQEERFLSDEDIVDIKRELVNKVANELDDEFGYEIDKFDIDVHYFVGVFLKDNPNVFGRVLSKKNSDDWYISGADVQFVLKEALPSFRRKIAFMKKVEKI